MNCVRFSPQSKIDASVKLLASGGDGGVVFLWRPSTREAVKSDLNEDEDNNLEHWIAYATLNGQGQDIYDICWSPNGDYLCTGLTDHSIQIWDVSQSKCVRSIMEHTHFVQGVCWNFQGDNICSASNDRSVKIYRFRKDSSDVHISKLCTIKKLEKEDSKKRSMFVDETLASFFRRINFSPDGLYLYSPAGISDTGSNCVYIHSRNRLNK